MPATVSSSTVTTRPPQQGNRLRKRLERLGIYASKVTQSRSTGQYAVKFSDPQQADFYSKGTDSAVVWAARIQAALRAAVIGAKHDSVADWRPNKPVLFATVFVTLPNKKSV